MGLFLLFSVFVFFFFPLSPSPPRWRFGGTLHIWWEQWLSPRPQQHQSDDEPEEGATWDTSAFQALKTTPSLSLWRLRQIAPLAFKESHSKSWTLLSHRLDAKRRKKQVPCYPRHCLLVTLAQLRELGVPPPKPPHPSRTGCRKDASFPGHH